MGRIHFHEVGITVGDGIKVLEKIKEGEVAIVINEGYWKLDLQRPTPFYERRGDEWQKVEEAQAIALIPALFSKLSYFEDSFSPKKILEKAGFKSIGEIKEYLRDLHKHKEIIDWFTTIFLMDKERFSKPVRPDSHYHIIEEIKVAARSFNAAGVGRVINGIEEGYGIYNLTRPYEIKGFDERQLGYGEVIPVPTRTSYLKFLREYLPISEILLALIGRDSVQHLQRTLKYRFPQKSDRDWITLEAIYIQSKSI